MKKVILSLVFVLATGSLVNASTSSEQVLKKNQVSIETIQQIGHASDCVKFAKNMVTDYAAQNDMGMDRDDPDFQYLINLYNMIYKGCYNG